MQPAESLAQLVGFDVIFSTHRAPSGRSCAAAAAATETMVAIVAEPYATRTATYALGLPDGMGIDRDRIIGFLTNRHDIVQLHKDTLGDTRGRRHHHARSGAAHRNRSSPRQAPNAHDPSRRRGVITAAPAAANGATAKPKAPIKPSAKPTVKNVVLRLDVIARGKPIAEHVDRTSRGLSSWLGPAEFAIDERLGRKNVDAVIEQHGRAHGART